MQKGNGSKQKKGAIGEEQAVKYLINCGFKIIGRNFRYSRFGELDIIAEEGEYICFIEVKTRSGTIYGPPCEAVGAKKQRSIRNLAEIYMKIHNMKDRYVRFDVAEVMIEEAASGENEYTVNLIRNAF